MLYAFSTVYSIHSVFIYVEYSACSVWRRKLKNFKLFIKFMFIKYYFEYHPSLLFKQYICLWKYWRCIAGAGACAAIPAWCVVVFVLVEFKIPWSLQSCSWRLSQPWNVLIITTPFYNGCIKHHLILFSNHIIVVLWRSFREYSFWNDALLSLIINCECVHLFNWHSTFYHVVVVQ